MIDAAKADEPADREADRIAGLLLRDPRRHNVLNVLAEEEPTLDEVVRILFAVLGPPQAPDWRLIGNPKPHVCLEMASELDQLAARLAEASAEWHRGESPVAASWPCGWQQLMSVALLGRVVSLQFPSALQILGHEECSTRLNSFARLLRSVALVG